MCKTFSSSLKGAMLSWYYKLGPRSVDSFEELSQMFYFQFVLSMKVRMCLFTSSTLCRISSFGFDVLHSFNKDMI